MPTRRKVSDRILGPRGSLLARLLWPTHTFIMAAHIPKVVSAPPKKLAVYGLGQFGFAMTELFSAKHPQIPIEAYDPVAVCHLQLV